MSNDNSSATVGTDRDADEAAIRALLDQQVQSWDVGDPRGYASVYAREGECVSFLGSRYQGREAIAASCEVPRAGSLFKRLLRGVRLKLEISHIRFLTPDVAVVHATCGATRGARPSRRNLRTNTSIAVRTADGWLLAASQNTTRQPLAERLISKLVS